MKDTFEKFFYLLKKDRKETHWTKSQNLNSVTEVLKDEIKELEVEINKKNIENIKDELGDVLWDTLLLSIIAEEELNITFEDTLKSCISKFKRRKPWIFSGEKLTKEEQLERWNEIKKTLKIRKNQMKIKVNF